MVGTQQKSARPYRNCTGSKGICTIKNPIKGVNPRMAITPKARVRGAEEQDRVGGLETERVGGFGSFTPQHTIFHSFIHGDVATRTRQHTDCMSLRFKRDGLCIVGEAITLLGTTTESNSVITSKNLGTSSTERWLCGESFSFFLFQRAQLPCIRVSLCVRTLHPVNLP